MLNLLKYKKHGDSQTMNKKEFKEKFDKEKPSFSKVQKKHEMSVVSKALVTDDGTGIPPKYSKLAKIIEEMNELEIEISKEMRGSGDRIHIIEEIGDVMVCIHYIQKMFDISEEDIQKSLQVKINRLDENNKKHIADLKKSVKKK